MKEKLDEAKLDQALVTLNKKQDTPWIIKDGMLHKIFEFDSFVNAFAFITQVALSAQRLNHHPDFRSTYKVVEFYLHTHKCSGVSPLDFDLAKIIDQCAGHFE